MKAMAFGGGLGESSCMIIFVHTSGIKGRLFRRDVRVDPMSLRFQHSIRADPRHQTGYYSGSMTV